MRRSHAILGSALAAGTAILVSAPAASAAVHPSTPGNCVFYTRSYSVGFVNCQTGTGNYRGRITCTDQLRGSSVYYYGPVETAGSGISSGGSCPTQGGVTFQATGGIAVAA